MAKVSRFYGFNPDYIASMSAPLFYQYCKAIEVIEARELLDLISVNEYSSNMKQKDRAVFLSKLDKRANPFKAEKVLTTDQILKELS